MMSSQSQSKPEQYRVGDDSIDSDPLVTPEDDIDPVISVVMPTLNEEEGVAECIQRTKAALRELEVPGEVILSDSSTDRTPEIGANLGARIVKPPEEGYGFAYQYGFEHARGVYIVMGDADTTYDFSTIPELLEPVRQGEADIVMGTRLDGEIKDGAMPALHQYIGNPLLTKFLNTFYDAGVSDAHSGFRVFHRDVLESLDLQTRGMEFASEMVMEAGARDLTIEERPIVYHERTGEATLESFRDGWRHIRFMLLNAPGYLFTIPGGLMALFGLGVLLAATSNLTFGSVGLGTHSAIAGSLFILVGYQVGNMGAFATVGSDPIQRPSDPLTQTLIDGLTLERLTMIGLGLFASGGAYATWLVVRWVSSGFARLPVVAADILAFTAIVLGVQTVFNAFLLSAMADS